MKFREQLNFLFIFMMTVFLISCDSDVEDVNSESENVSFSLKQIQLVSKQSISSQSAWPEVKDSSSIDLKVCMIDNAYLQSIVGEDFQIDTDLSSHNKTSDANGCITWNETFEFNYLQDETFYSISGDITGEDSNLGMKSFNLAYNPWTGELVDLAYGSVQKVTAIANKMAKANTNHSLEVKDITINFTQKVFEKDKTSLSMEVSMMPEIRRVNLNGMYDYEKLSKGNFEVTYYLISKHANNNERHLLATTKTKGSILPDGKLISNPKFTLYSGVDSNYKIELGVEIKSLYNEGQMGTDSGFMSVSKLDGTLKSELRNTQVNFKELPPVDNQDKSMEEVDDQFGFIVDTIQITNSHEEGQNLDPNTNDRIVNAVFNIKVVDSLVKENVIDHRFEVEVTNLENGEVFTPELKNSNFAYGIIRFDMGVKFKDFSKRTWKKFNVKVTSSKSPFKGLSKERTVFINPFIKGDGFGQDSKYRTPKEYISKTPPTIYIDKVNTIFIQNETTSFKLNKNLDLQLEKTLSVKFRPQMKPMHDFNGKPEDYPAIVTGKFKMKVLLLTPKRENYDVSYTKEINLDQYKIITAAEKEITVESGDVSAFLNLPMRFEDHREYALKSLIVIEMSSLEEDIELDPGYFIGNFVGKNKKNEIEPLMETGKVISKKNISVAKELQRFIKNASDRLLKDYEIGNQFNNFINRLKEVTANTGEVPVYETYNHKIVNKKIDLKVFHTENQFKNLKDNDLQLDEVVELVNHPNKPTQRQIDTLCHLLYDKNDVYSQDIGHYQDLKVYGLLYNKCRENPKAYIVLKSFHHLDKITEQPTFVNSNSFEIGRSTAYFMSHGHSFHDMEGIRNSNFSQHSFSASLGLEGGFGLFHGSAGYGYSRGTRLDVYSVTQKQEMATQLNRQIYSTGVKFNATKFDVKFRALAKSCILIAGNFFKQKIHKKKLTKWSMMLEKWAYKTTEPVLQTSNKRYYICSEKKRDMEMDESWYVVTMNHAKSMADLDLEKNTKVEVRRGEESFENYRQNEIENDRVLILDENIDQQVVKDYHQFLDENNNEIEYKKINEMGFPGLVNDRRVFIW